MPFAFSMRLRAPTTVAAFIEAPPVGY